MWHTSRIAELIGAHAAARPAAPALKTAHHTLSYGELWNRSMAVSRQLHAHNVPARSVVAVNLPSAPEAVVAMLGTWLAGAVIMPIDTATPQQRVDYLLQNSGAFAMLTGDGAIPLGTRTDTVLQGDPAYVIYTSGSTGMPKGVLVDQDALAGHVTAITDLLHLTSHDTVLQFASLGFDVAQEEIWPTLTAGGTVAFHQGGLPDADTLAALTRELGVTLLQLPTAYWRMLCSELDGADHPSFAHIRTVVIGGENATSVDAQVHRRTPMAHTTLVNGYGPTETVITATALVLAPDECAPATDSLPIGGPVGLRAVYVLDQQGHPVSSGEDGELWVGGPLLARGYLNDAEATQARFVPDPFASQPCSRMYRTGDRVRRHPDGNLEFLGRVDNQVKIRGHRVELDEADRYLMDVPGVSAAVTFVLDDGIGGQILAAAVASSGQGPSPDEIRAHLRAEVPAYLVPGRITILESLPLTTSGKIDRRAAAAVTARAPHTGAGARGSGLHPLEAAVQVMRDLLQTPSLEPDDDFLAYGGDSLMAMRVCAYMRSLGVPMRPADVLEGRTPRAAVERARGRSLPAAAGAYEESGPVELLPSQRRWLHDGEMPERDHFCLNALFSVEPNWTGQRLEDVAAELLRRHPALRTVLIGSHTARLGTANQAGAVRRVDVAHMPPPERIAMVERALAQAQKSLALADGRTFQLLYVLLGDGTARLLLTVHHFVLDGVSMGLLVDDLETLLGEGRLDSAATGPRAIGTALDSWLGSSQAREDARSWAAQAGRPFAVLTPDMDGPDRLPSLRTHRFRLPKEATRLVTHALPARGIAPRDFVLTSLVGGLAGWTGEPVHGVDVYAHSRDVAIGDLDLSRTVGYVQSTFPAVLPWIGDGAAALRGALDALAALPKRRYGFDALRFGSPDPAERALLQSAARPVVRLNFRGHLMRLEQRAPGSILKPATEEIGAHRSPLQRERYLLMAEGDIREDQLEVSVKYASGHFSAQRIETLAEAIRTTMHEILARAASSPTQPGGHQ